MALTEQTGFPVKLGSQTAGTAVGLTGATLVASGDLLILEFFYSSGTDLITSVSCPGVVGGTMTQAAKQNDATNGFSIYLYFGTTNATGAKTITVNASSSITIGSATIDEWTAGSPQTWLLDQHTPSTGNSATIAFGSLTPTQPGIYWGGSVIENSPGTGVGTGFTFGLDATSNPICFNQNVLAGTTYAPTIPQGAGFWDAVSGTFYFSSGSTPQNITPSAASASAAIAAVTAPTFIAPHAASASTAASTVQAGPPQLAPTAASKSAAAAPLTAPALLAPSAASASAAGNGIDTPPVITSPVNIAPSAASASAAGCTVTTSSVPNLTLTAASSTAATMATTAAAVIAASAAAVAAAAAKATASTLLTPHASSTSATAAPTTAAAAITATASSRSAGISPSTAPAKLTLTAASRSAAVSIVTAGAATPVVWLPTSLALSNPNATATMQGKTLTATMQGKTLSADLKAGTEKLVLDPATADFILAND